MTPGDSSHYLKPGSKLGLNYTVQSKRSSRLDHLFLNGAGRPEPISTFLGSLNAVWNPIALAIPDEIVADNDSKTAFDIAEIGLVHGPLQSHPPPILQFQGPQCNVESTPFFAELTSFPPSPKVATPFEFYYSIMNKTPLNQRLVVSMSETSTSSGIGENSNGILVSGLVAGVLQLGPYESKTLAYSALVMKAGKVPMPALSVISSRYQSWVIHDAKNPQFCYVLP